MSDFGQPPGWAPPPGSQPGGFQQQPGGFQQQPGAPYGGPGGFGPPPGGMGPGAQQGASGMAIASLVLGCLSFVCGGFFLSIPGAIIGKMEMTKIANGESPKAGDGLAKAGFYISIANLALFVIGGCLYAMLFAFALVAGAAQS